MELLRNWRVEFNKLDYYKLYHKNFGPATYLRLETRTSTLSREDEEPPKAKEKGNTREVCLDTPYYEEMIRRHGQDFGWLLQNNYRKDFGGDECHDYFVASAELMEAYKNFYIREILRLLDTDRGKLLETLEAGDLSRIVRGPFDWNHCLYDLRGEPIRRKIAFDYIGGFCGRKYRVKSLAEHLGQIPGISDLEVIAVLYYNQDIPGEEAVEFSYLPPTDEEFRGLIALSGGFERSIKLEEILDLKKFRKEEEED